MNKEINERNLGLDPKNPWTIVPESRREQLFHDLNEIAKNRKKSLTNARDIPLP